MIVEKLDDVQIGNLPFPQFWENLSRGVTLILDKDEDLFCINTAKHAFETHMIECFIVRF